MIKLKSLSEEEKEELVLLVVQQLNFTIKEYYTRDTVIDTGIVLNLIQLTIKRIELKEEPKQLQDESTR